MYLDGIFDIKELVMKWFKKWKASKIADVDAREKKIAEIDNTPWVKVINVGFEDPNNPSTGHFELDWNKQFIDQLVEAGYSGRADEDIVDMWFNDLCRGVVGDKI